MLLQLSCALHTVLPLEIRTRIRVAMLPRLRESKQRSRSWATLKLDACMTHSPVMVALRLLGHSALACARGMVQESQPMKQAIVAVLKLRCLLCSWRAVVALTRLPSSLFCASLAAGRQQHDAGRVALTFASCAHAASTGKGACLFTGRWCMPLAAWWRCWGDGSWRQNACKTPPCIRAHSQDIGEHVCVSIAGCACACMHIMPADV